MIALGQDVRRLELWAAAAAAAREVLREAVASKSCAWWTLFVALKVHAHALHVVCTHCTHTACALHADSLVVALQVLQWLPPAVAVVAHAEVAALLNDESRAVMAIAAHTLACLGPEAVCVEPMCLSV